MTVNLPIQLIDIYIVKCLDNCEYSNDYKIDHIHSQMTIQLTISHRQMTNI